MSKGGYLGGSTLIRPGSDWFGRDKGKIISRKGRKKKRKLTPKTQVAGPPEPPSLTKQAKLARGRANAARGAVERAQAAVRAAQLALEAATSEAERAEAEAVRLEGLASGAAPLNPGPRGRLQAVPDLPPSPESKPKTSVKARSKGARFKPGARVDAAGGLSRKRTAGRTCMTNPDFARQASRSTKVTSAKELTDGSAPGPAVRPKTPADVSFISVGRKTKSTVVVERLPSGRPAGVRARRDEG